MQIVSYLFELVLPNFSSFNQSTLFASFQEDVIVCLDTSHLVYCFFIVFMSASNMSFQSALMIICF